MSLVISRLLNFGVKVNLNKNGWDKIDVGSKLHVAIKMTAAQKMGRSGAINKLINLSFLR